MIVLQKIAFESHELPFAVSEELKLLATNLQFFGSEKKVILVTSASPDEGKSLICRHLSRTLAEMGKKVLLLDADLRKSAQKHYLSDGEIQYGLSHILSGQCQITDAIAETETKGFYAILAGYAPPNSHALLSNQYMLELLQQSREQFDYILLDTPPLGTVSDAGILARQADGAVLVIRAGAIRYRMAQDVVRTLNNAGCEVFGAVLNMVGRRKDGRGYGRNYGYGYGYGYKSAYGYGYQYGSDEKKKRRK